MSIFLELLIEMFAKCQVFCEITPFLKKWFILLFRIGRALVFRFSNSMAGARVSASQEIFQVVVPLDHPELVVDDAERDVEGPQPDRQHRFRRRRLHGTRR